MLAGMKLRHRETGVETPLEEGMVVGRLAECGLQIEDGSVSRRHARFERRGEQWWVVDLGSSNGTRHNGRTGREFAFRGGDLVTFGAVAFDVLAPVATAAAPVTPGAVLVEEAAPVSGDDAAAAATSAARARLHAELRARPKSRGLGDLNQLSLGMQLLVGVVGLAFLVGVVLGVRWLGESM
jgi:predicted component of type VI protein secretion system